MNNFCRPPGAGLNRPVATLAIRCETVSVTPQGEGPHPAVGQLGNEVVPPTPAGGRQKLAQAPGNPRLARSAGSAMTGLSRRRPRVRVPSVPGSDTCQRRSTTDAARRESRPRRGRSLSCSGGSVKEAIRGPSVLRPPPGECRARPSPTPRLVVPVDGFDERARVPIACARVETSDLRNSLSLWTRPSIKLAHTSSPGRLPPISTRATAVPSFAKVSR
jgi:hypothetical protein